MSDETIDNIRFLLTIFSVGFITGQVLGENLSFSFAVISVLAVWGLYMLFSNFLSGEFLSGLSLLKIVWTIVAVAAIFGSVVASSRYGPYAFPITVILAFVAASKWPLFGLLLGIMIAGALSTRYGRTSAHPLEGHREAPNFAAEWPKLGSDKSL